MKPISFEFNGFPEFLRSESACRKAIDRGTLTPETPVIAYGEDGLRERMPAGEHPLLRGMFNLDAPAPEAPPASPPVVVPAAAAAVPADAASPPALLVPGAAVEASAPQDETAAPPLEAESPEQLPARPQADPDSVGIKIAFGVGAALVLVLALSQCGSSTSDKAASTDAPAADDAALAASQAAADAAAAQTYYAVRPVQIRTGPWKDAPRVILLPRGTELSGISTPSATEAGYFWLRIVSGEYAGKYTSMLNLSAEARPELDTSTAGTWYTTEDVTPLEAPNDSAAKKTGAAWQLSAGAALDVAGVTGAGTFTSGWAEIMLPKDSGVGYIPLDRLTRESPAAAEAAAVAADAAAEGDAGNGTQPLRIKNACNNPLNMLIRYQSQSGWESTTVYLTPGVPVTVATGGYGGVISSEIYFLSLAGNRSVRATGAGSYAEFDGRSYTLKKANVVNQSGVYSINFTC